MQVVNLTTPSNYFHVLRRQMRREFRKPLIIMTPKSLLRHKRCVSSLNQMENGTTFHRVLWDERHGTKELNKDENIRRVVLCSGKVYYDLVEERDKRQLTDIFIMRLEQLYPFPEKALTADLAKFKNAEFVWCQEEPRNMGAWFFIRERVENVLEEINGKNDPFRYVGRPEAASPATGSLRRHNMEQEDLVNEALSLPPKQPIRKTPAKKPARKRQP